MGRDFLVILLVDADLLEPVSLIELFSRSIRDLDMKIYMADLGLRMGRSSGKNEIEGL